MPFHFFTDADRQAMRDAAEERWVLAELEEEYAPDFPEGAIEVTPREEFGRIRRPWIDPYRRS